MSLIYSANMAARPATPAKAWAATVAMGMAPATDEAALEAEPSAEDTALDAEPEADSTAEEAELPALDAALDAAPVAEVALEEADDPAPPTAPVTELKMVLLPRVDVMVLPSVVMVVTRALVEMALRPAPPAAKIVVLPTVEVRVLPSVVMVVRIALVVTAEAAREVAEPPAPTAVPLDWRAEVAAPTPVWDARLLLAVEDALAIAALQ